MQQQDQPINDEQINEQLTAIAKQDKKYSAFLEWLTENGAVYDGIDFPVAFGKSGYIGASASKEIKPYKCIMAIPEKLIISVETTENSILKPIFKKNKSIFDPEENNDADFNKLTLFLLYEKIKGKKSFWKPYFDIVDQSYTTLSYSKKEMELMQDQYLIKSTWEFKKDMEQSWDDFKKVLKNHPDVFPKGEYSRELYFWCYELVMTRCFGWSIKSTSLIPFADCLNHSNRNVTSYIVNKQFEENNNNDSTNQYRQKKFKYDLSLLQINENLSQAEQQERAKLFKNKAAEYIVQNKDLIQKKDLKQCLEDQSNDELVDYVREINQKKLQNDANLNIWNEPFFSESDSEDNDTEEEEEEEGEEKKQDDMKSIGEKEQLENEQFFKNKNLSVYDQATLKDNSDIVQQLQQQQQQQQQQSQEEEKKNEQNSKYESLNEEEWEWYQENDQNNYFALVSEKYYKANEQLYNSYGNRTNRFLLQWYGFCYPNNVNDSYSFRLVFKNKYEELISNKIKLDDLVFDDYLAFDDEEEQKVVFQYADKQSIRRTIPTNLKFELTTLTLARDIVEHLYNQQSKTYKIEDDKVLLLQQLNFKERFAVVLRHDHKQILKKQLLLLNIALKIVEQLDQNKDFRQSYLTLLPQLENQEQMFENRQRIRNYLREIYINIILKKQLSQN